MFTINTINIVAIVKFSSSMGALTVKLRLPLKTFTASVIQNDKGIASCFGTTKVTFLCCESLAQRYWVLDYVRLK